VRLLFPNGRILTAGQEQNNKSSGENVADHSQLIRNVNFLPICREFKGGEPVPEANQSLKILLGNVWRKNAMAISVFTIAMLGSSPTVIADGTDILEPTSAVLANGSGIIGAGVGLSQAQPGNIEIEIPPGVSVEQVLIYWDGDDRDYAGAPPIIGVTTDTIEVSGIDVEGVFIGGRTYRTVQQQFAFRADITSLGLVSPGSNMLAVEGLDFGNESVESGAGVLVIVDDGTTSTLGILDGSDYAYIKCFDADANCFVTVKRMFTFPAASSARDGDLTMFFASVAGTASGGGFRPSTVRVWIGGAPPIEIVNQLDSVDGEEWDTLNVEFEIPAGVTQVEVQAFSEDSELTGNNPASFKWLAAALGVPNEEQGGQGCTPGYWKQEHHFADWTAPYDPDDLFSDHFENAFPGLTLVEVADGNGGGLTALGRHTVAALLNAASAEVSNDRTVQEVIDAFNGVYPGSKGEYEALKDEFEGFNEQGCPLNNDDGSNNGNGQSSSGFTSPDATGADFGNRSSGGGAFGHWEILAFLVMGFGTFLHRRREQ